MVAVRQGGRLLKRVDLRSKRVRHHRAVPVRSFARPKRGPVVVQVLSNGRPVRIDGIVVRR